jgi:lipoprotein signal peptidase
MPSIQDYGAHNSKHVQPIMKVKNAGKKFSCFNIFVCVCVCVCVCMCVHSVDFFKKSAFHMGIR